MMFERSWYYRRLAFFLILGVGLALISYVTIWGVDDALRRDSMTTISFLVFSAFVTYMTGSVLDDRFKGKELIAKTAVDQSNPSTTETSVEVKQ